MCKILFSARNDGCLHCFRLNTKEKIIMRRGISPKGGGGGDSPIKMTGALVVPFRG